MGDFGYEKDFLYALALTVSIETGMLYVLLYTFERRKTGLRDMLLGGVLPSFATLPYLWFIFPVFFVGNHTLYLVVGELSIMLIEALILKGVLDIMFSRALLYSVIVNSCSYFLSVLR